MAGEIGHVVYGARLLSHLGDEVTSPLFWAGTLFPDIRHLGMVSRKRTHPADVSLQTLVGANDFVTGMRVHAWIDATRENFLREHNMKETLPWHPFVPHALKWVEDEMLYEKYDDWNLIHRALNEVKDEELELAEDRERIGKWHSILQDYFSQKPTDESREALAVGIGLSQTSAVEINNVVHMLQGNAQTKKLIDQFLVHLESLLA